GAEELDHEQVRVAVDHQAGQAVAFAVDHAPGVGHRVEVQHVAAQAHRFADAVCEPGCVDGDLRTGLEHAQGDARVAVVEAAADPSAVHAHHVDDAAGPGPLRRLVDQLLEDPRMAAAPGVAQVDGGDGLVHARIIAQGPSAPVPER